MRRKTEAPATVSARQLASELQLAHGWASGTPEAAEWCAARVAEFAKTLGLDVAPYWLPTMSADQARRVLDTVLAYRDPLDVAEERDAMYRDEFGASPTLRPAELVAHFGAALARPGVSVPQSEAYGPTDPVGPLRAESVRREGRLVSGETPGHQEVW